MGYGVALLLNMTMYMIFISDKLPEKSDSVPFVGALFVTLFFLASLALVLSALTMHYSSRETPLPNFAHKIKALTDRMWPFKGKSLVRSKSSKYGSYDMNVRQSASNGGSKPNGNDAANEDLHRKASLLQHAESESNSVKIAPGNDEEQGNRFTGWFEFMRFTEKWLTGVFAFLLIVIPMIIAGSVNKRLTQPEY